MLADCGALSILIGAGARILESACGPCIGMGQSPNSKGISLRTFNRNFLGRSGTRTVRSISYLPKQPQSQHSQAYSPIPDLQEDMPPM